MKVSFFLLKFPLSSETFVLNQITAFIDMGHEVEIVALQKGDTQHTHAAWEKYGLAAKTRWLQDEPQGRLAKLRYRACKTLPGLHRAATWKALNFTRYGDESRNLILSAICAQVSQPFGADVFIAHFGPAGVRRPNYANWACFAAKSRLFSTGLIFPAAKCSVITRRSISSCFVVAI